MKDTCPLCNRRVDVTRASGVFKKHKGKDKQQCPGSFQNKSDLLQFLEEIKIEET